MINKTIDGANIPESDILKKLGSELTEEDIDKRLITQGASAEDVANMPLNQKRQKPAFLTKKAITINRSLTKSSFDPDVRFSRQTTVCCWSSSLHQNQLEVEQKAIYSA